MNGRQRRYWALRTDKTNQALLFGELQAGRARQGWGYDDTQDLTAIQRKVAKGGRWWEKLTKTQKEVLPHYRMLGEGDDSIKIGDILLLPNLPSHNFFCFAKVEGEYYFEIHSVGDYGHILPVKLLTPIGINKYSDEVHGNIRKTLRTVNRMWNIDPYKKDIDKLLVLDKQGNDLTSPSSGSERLANAWGNALLASKKLLFDQLGKELDARFQAAEWEEPILTVIRNLYPDRGLEVRWTAGQTENGADIVISVRDHFDIGLSWLIVVQVKNYTGDIMDARALEQIEQAHNHYSREGRILAGVIMTTAEKGVADFSAKKEALEVKLGIPIKLILKKQLIELMTEGLSAK